MRSLSRSRSIGLPGLRSLSRSCSIGLPGLRSLSRSGSIGLPGASPATFLIFWLIGFFGRLDFSDGGARLRRAIARSKRKAEGLGEKIAPS